MLLCCSFIYTPIDVVYLFYSIVVARLGSGSPMSPEVIHRMDGWMDSIVLKTTLSLVHDVTGAT